MPRKSLTELFADPAKDYSLVNMLTGRKVKAIRVGPPRIIGRESGQSDQDAIKLNAPANTNAFERGEEQGLYAKNYYGIPIVYYQIGAAKSKK
jgi:hypothetical protein